VARGRLDGGWDVPQSALDTDQQDRLGGRVRMLNGALEGGMESWTLPLEQWEMSRKIPDEVRTHQVSVEVLTSAWQVVDPRRPDALRPFWGWWA
jgi:hypothetical protein